MKNIIIGFLIGVSTLLLIGARETSKILETPPEEMLKHLIGIREDSNIGKYQAYFDKNDHMMIDTETGILYYYKKGLGNKHWVRWSRTTNWIEE